MKESKEVAECKKLFYILGREDKIKLINESNLTNRERVVLQSRFIEGLSAKESSVVLGLGLDAYNKLQQRTYKKFYIWFTVNKV